MPAMIFHDCRLLFCRKDISARDFDGFDYPMKFPRLHAMRGDFAACALIFNLRGLDATAISPPLSAVIAAIARVARPGELRWSLHAPG